MVGRLDAIDGLRCRSPEGAFYAFPDVRGLLGRRYGDQVVESSVDLATLLIEKHGVATVAGAPFGAEGFIRLSFATSMEQIDKGLDAIESFVSTLGD